ncbi:MAG TPA: TetR/AcrR family transcriptional regulator [Polyangia bacterium]|jgi:AcrR family transcriptional regulator
MNARSPSDTKAQSLRSRLKEATAAAILDAAEELFAEKGLSAAHMNEIAAKAGVAVGTLYNHFEDRDALLSALVETRRDEILEVMDEFLAQPSSGDFRTDLTALVQLIGGFFQKHRRFHLIMHRLEWGLHTGNFPATATCAPVMKREMYTRLDKLIRRGLKQKALRAELADQYAYLLLGLFRSIRLQQIDEGLDPERPIDVGAVVRFFMEGAAV